MSALKSNPETNTEVKNRLWGSTRLGLSVLLFLAVVQDFMLRFNLSMTIVCMKGASVEDEVRIE